MAWGDSNCLRWWRHSTDVTRPTTCELTRPAASHFRRTPAVTLAAWGGGTLVTGGMLSDSLSSISNRAWLFIPGRGGMFSDIRTEDCAPKTQTRRRRVNARLLTCTLITWLITEGWRWKTIHTCAANDESTREGIECCYCRPTRCGCFDLDVSHSDKSDNLYSG